MGLAAPRTDSLEPHRVRFTVGAGVPEVWIVDIAAQRLAVHRPGERVRLVGPANTVRPQRLDDLEVDLSRILS